MRRARRSINQINVVPYIDVMLVLLVIFMITAPLVNPGQIALPSVASKLPAAPPLPLQITVDEKDGISLEDRAAKTHLSHLSRDELVAAISKLQGSGDRPVVIAAAGSTRYQDVIELIDLLQRNGIRRVGLLAQTKGG
jgi:biopolymer transport protein TolR